MKTLALFPVLLILVLSSYSLQAGQENWRKGVVFLNNNEVIKGDLNYNQKHDLLQCEVDGVVKVYAPHQVKLFQYYDEAVANNKVYTSLKDPMKGSRKKSFYEVILTGRITLLRNEPKIKVTQVPVKSSPEEGKAGMGIQFEYFETIVYDYFILYNDQLKKLNDYKAQILPLLKKEINYYEAFIKENNLDLNNIYDVLKVVEHYNDEKHEMGVNLL